MQEPDQAQLPKLVNHADPDEFDGKWRENKPLLGVVLFEFGKFQVETS